MGLTVRAKGQECEFADNDVATTPYLVRMGLFDNLGIDPPRNISKHEQAGKFIPIKQVQNNNDLQDYIVNIIPMLHVDPSATDPVKQAISEMVRNVLEHSRSQIGCTVCAQYYSKKKRVAIGICDAGIGIKQAMSIHKPRSHWQAMRLALTPGITGKTTRVGGTSYNAGAGLFMTKSISIFSRSYFCMYSGTSLFKAKPVRTKDPIRLPHNPERDHCTIHDDMPRFDGTAVGIDIATDKLRRFATVLKLIREAYSEGKKLETKKKYQKPKFT